PLCSSVNSVLNSLHHITLFFLFNDPPTTQLSPLSLHDALPISELKALDPLRAEHPAGMPDAAAGAHPLDTAGVDDAFAAAAASRSEEHTSELQSLRHLVCRLLLEKKKKKKISIVSAHYKTESDK